jgi:hypothetical protein
MSGQESRNSEPQMHAKGCRSIRRHLRTTIRAHLRLAPLVSPLCFALDRRFALSLALTLLLAGVSTAQTDCWIPARWQGGPLEVERRIADQTLPADPALREAIRQWYEPETLHLLDGTPVNCLLVTWSIGADAAIESQQHQLVTTFAREAHARGIAVLGLVYPGSDPAAFVEPAAEAGLDGLVLEGEHPGGDRLVHEIKTVLCSRNQAAVVIPLAAQPGRLRSATWPILAVEGTRPHMRQLTEMAIEAGPSSEPWIDSNIWLVRSLRTETDRRPVWLGHELSDPGTADYELAVADGAIAGGHWILALDDQLRMNLRCGQPAALATRRRIGAYLNFYRGHAEWNEFVPAGPLGIVLDPAGENPEISDEYLNLLARRRIPYRVVRRAGLAAADLDGLAAVLATALAPPSDTERSVLRAFADKGGLVVAGRSWGGDVPKDQDFTEQTAGRGRMVVFSDDLPEPESLSKKMMSLLDDDLNMRFFNVPSVLIYASRDTTGRKLLLQLLNYSTYPAQSLTVRLYEDFRAAQFHTPEGGVTELAVDRTGGRTEILIPELPVAGALLLEK